MFDRRMETSQSQTQVDLQRNSDTLSSMLRPEDNRVQSQLFSLLNNPAMLHRGGNPFGSDLGRASMAGFSTFPSNKLTLSSIGVGGISVMNQYPPQRIQASLRQGASGMQSSFGMLPEMGIRDKRTATDETHGKDAKRQKLCTTTPSALNDNPKLLERLSSLSGGFPGPKWGSVKKIKIEDESKRPEKKGSSHRGSFPMPALADCRAKNMSKISLNTYRELWKDTDIDLREEVLARKLERASYKMSHRKFLSS